MIRFTIPGEPQPQGRPRARVIKGTFAQFYTDPKTRASVQAFQEAAKEFKPEQPLEGPIIVQLIFYKKKTSTYKKDENYWDRKPDLDNLIKLALDSMNKIFFKDDAQIVEIIASKMFDDEPRTVVAITPVEEKQC